MSQLDREDEATKLLKEAGYGEGGKPLKIEIRYNTNANHEKVATAVADNWKALGIDVSLVNLDIKSHYAYLQEGGTFDVARAGWVADYADAENFLFLCISTNNTFNYGHYNNPKYDELMAQSYKETDLVKRQQILHDAEAMLMQDQPIAPFMNYGIAVARVEQGEGLRRQRGQRAPVALHVARITDPASAGPGHMFRGRGRPDLVMLNFVLRRLLSAVPTIFIVVTISFFLIRFAPGGPFNHRARAAAADHGEHDARLSARSAALSPIPALSLERPAPRFRSELHLSRLHRRRS